MPPLVDVSVVVPVLNEEPTVRVLARRVTATLEARDLSFELIFVDDGSTDGTAAVLRELERADSRLRVLELTRNFGQAAALACGLFDAHGDIVVTMDGDLQNPPEEIPKLLDALAAGADIVSARRAARHDPAWRRLGARSVHWFARYVTGASIEDFGGQFKAYRREALEVTRANWSPGKPFFVLAMWLGFAVREVTVRHDPRARGSSRYTLASLVRVNIDLITSFTTLPLALLGVLGLLGTAGGALGALACLWSGATRGLGAMLSVAMLATGAVFGATSILGIYVARLYRTLAGVGPGYVVRRGPAHKRLEVAQPGLRHASSGSPR